VPEIKTIAMKNGMMKIKTPLKNKRGYKPKPTANEHFSS
jgi:hypothetical protein